MLNGFFEIFLYALVMAFICALPATPIFCYLRKVFYVPIAQKKIMKKAIADGHVVQAKLADSGAMVGGSEYAIPTGEWRAVYHYQYAGKTYTYRGISNGWPAEEVTLYFETKPNRACTYHELGYRESNWKKYYCWMVCVCFLVFLVCEAYKYAV